ncbi:MAG TPA: heparan-alpha-glucosaminide N-acetyltransferase domain-containing protein [Drouetiella sp.]
MTQLSGSIEPSTVTVQTTTVTTTVTTKRFLPLDVFRGMTVCFMIIVNTPGTSKLIYPALDHAKWHGFTPTDLVFPSFLFAVGNALSFTLSKYEAKGNRAVLLKTLKRTAIIFFIGFILLWLPFNKTLDHTRIPGVLQRIALCYCGASLMIHYLPRKVVIALSIIFLLAYWAILYCFGAPGDQYSLQGNAVLPLDLFVLGPGHMYKGEGIPFDPEGILSTIPAVVNVLAGYYTGCFIQKHAQTPGALGKITGAGIALVALAQIWNIVFPINKKLWTSSYVLQTVGIDLVILAAMIAVIDRLHWEKWTEFFTVFGKNTLFIYVLSDLFIIAMLHTYVSSDMNVYRYLTERVQSVCPGEPGSLLFGVTAMLVCWIICKILDWKKIYIKV